MVDTPRTPEQLLEHLAAIFPEFRKEWEDDEVPETFHGVMLCFTPFFGVISSKLPPEALRKLGGLINRAVALDDDLENAVATCFLEHLHQINAWRALKPYLNDRAKRKAYP